jgi:TPR repeat protein
VIAGNKFKRKSHAFGHGFWFLGRIPISASVFAFGKVLAMIQAARTARLVYAAILFGAFAIMAASQAPFVKTTYGVSPAKVTVWASMHEPLSDADIAKVNSELFAKGNKDAAWELGLAYMQGLGVPQDFAKAEEMFRIGAMDADRKGMVGMFYAHGYFPTNLEAVEQWYKAAGRPHDLFEIGEAYKGAAEADKTKSATYYAKAIQNYIYLLKLRHGEERRAQLELGNFVIDGIYSAGDDPISRTKNLEWARLIAQELLGQKDYQIAVEYKIGQEDLPADEKMWLRYCKRAAAYNIDLAQHFYVEALNEGRARDFSGYDAIAWSRLSARDNPLLKAMTAGMSQKQNADADEAYQALIETRTRFGAYYAQDDSLRNPSAAIISAMDQEDPDVQLRIAFDLEKTAINDEQAYRRVLGIYRDVRDHRDTAPRFVLGRYALKGTNGIPKDRGVAEYWLHEAVRSGSKPAQELLDSIEEHSSGKE